MWLYDEADLDTSTNNAYCHTNDTPPLIYTPSLLEAHKAGLYKLNLVSLLLKTHSSGTETFLGDVTFLTKITVLLIHIARVVQISCGTKNRVKFILIPD